MSDLHDRMLTWYAENARDLPWRAPGTSPWAVLVSEIMLQQTPVSRVVPVYERWLEMWPTPRDLAAATSGDAVRAWGRLGYPRRALRLHATAVALRNNHAGQVPDDLAQLRSLPGVGDYTAAAVASFAFGGRHAVLDTNVRRVLGRLIEGKERPAPSLTKAERRLAESVIPEERPETWAVAIMELGALVCSASNPTCAICPVSNECLWLRTGSPAYDGPAPRSQTYVGTDRQVRGRILDVLRESADPVPNKRLDLAWPDPDQRDRALASLLEDGLVTRVGQRYALPG